MRRIHSAAVLLSIASLAAPSTDGHTEPRYEENVVLVGVPSSGYGTLQDATELVEYMLDVSMETQDSVNFYCNMIWPDDEIDMAVKVKWDSEAVSVQQVVDAYLSLGFYAQPNYAYRTFPSMGENLPPPSDGGSPIGLDPLARFQVPYPLGGLDPVTGLRYTQVTESWAYTEGTEEVVLQINDTGAYWWHPELGNLWQNLGEDADGDGSVLVEEDNYHAFDPGDENGIDDDGNGVTDDFIGWDFVDFGNDPMPNTGLDPFVHGMAVASVAAARNFNGGMWGVAQPPVRLQFVRTGSGGFVWTWEAIQGFGYAIETNLKRGVHVVANVSWGGLSGDNLLEHQLECFQREGGALVFAAGNYGNMWETWPANYHFGLIVCATDRGNERAGWSSYGEWIYPDGLSFPGDSVLVMRADVFIDDVDFSYVFADGTSFSAPGVAGLLAAYWAMHPELSEAEVRAALLESVYAPPDYPDVDPDPYSVSEYIGTGILDALGLMR